MEVVIAGGFAESGNRELSEHWRWTREDLEAWCIGVDGEIEFSFGSSQSGSDDKLTNFLLREWPADCCKGVRAVEVSVSIAAETCHCEAGIAVFVEDNPEEFVKLELRKGTLVLSKRCPDGEELLASQVCTTSEAVVLRLEIGEDMGVAAMLDMGHCLRVVGRDPSFKCGTSVGVCASGSSGDNITFRSFRMLEIDSQRHQFVGVPGMQASASGAAEFEPDPTQSDGSSYFVPLSGAGGLGGLGSSWTFSDTLSPDDLAEVKTMVGAGAGGPSETFHMSDLARMVDGGAGFAIVRPDAVLLNAEDTFRAALAVADHEPDPTQILDRCRKGIEDMHVFLNKWFNAEYAREAEAMAQFSELLDDSFHMITAAGARLDADGLRRLVDCAHGCTQTQSSFTIRIQDVQLMQVLRSRPWSYLVTYEEWTFEDRPDATTAKKLCTVLLRDEPDSEAAGGQRLKWLHVHEVTLPA